MPVISHTPSNKATLAKYLTNDETYGFVLLTIVLDLYGTDCLNWEIPTLEAELWDDFSIVLSQLNMDKLQALVTALTTDQFFEDWYCFNTTCECLNNDPIEPEVIDTCSPEQFAWGITEVALLFDSSDRPLFSDSTRRYLGICLDQVGIRKPLDVLAIAIMPDLMDSGMGTDTTFISAMSTKQSSDNDYIETYIKANLKGLIGQLNEVPISNRNQKTWDEIYEKYSKI